MPGPITESHFEAPPGRWCFRQVAPDPDLREAVVHYWEVEGLLAPFEETILPHGWLELMINLGPPHRIIGGESAGTWRQGWLSGLQEHAIRVESRRGTHLISARLSPVGAVDLLGFAAPRSANTVVDLRRALGRDGSDLVVAIRSARTPSARFLEMERFLRGHRKAVNVPEFVRIAAHTIEQRHGDLRVSTLHAGAGVSRKHLALTFKRFLGLSLRAYAKVRRFAWTLEQLGSPGPIDWTRLALEAGYADQSHMVRDFRRIGGRAATALLSRLSPDGISLWEDAR